MAAPMVSDAVENNGKPTKGTPVIRLFESSEEDVGSRVLHRYAPAAVISGAIHIVVIGVALILNADSKEAQAKPKEELIMTSVEEPKDEPKNLTEEEVGFDPDLKPATNSDNEAENNVVAETRPNEPVGLENQPNEMTAPAQLGFTPELAPGARNNLAESGSTPLGPGAGGGSFNMTPGLLGRTGSTKDKLIKDGGGNRDTEAAVARGLAWLAKKQLRDGSWEFDGGSTEKIAATGMALLPFLAAGETHKSATKYRDNVKKALDWLMSRVNTNGSFNGTNNMYAIGIATVALCEAAGMTKDKAVMAKAAAAVNFIVRAQGKNGSWGYGPGADGDTSIVGWQIQALASGRLAEVKFEMDKTYKEANRFLESVSVDSGSQYGYNTKSPTPTLSAVGLLSRYYMGNMGPRHRGFQRGVELLIKDPPDRSKFDMYHIYYATQVVHFHEGPEWHKVWNPKMQSTLLGLQVQAGENAGSWPKDMSFIGSQCGKIGTTAMALLTLEVYYRHLPLYKRDSGGFAEFEK